jgi:hypothetical protein
MLAHIFLFVDSVIFMVHELPKPAIAASTAQNRSFGSAKRKLRSKSSGSFRPATQWPLAYHPAEQPAGSSGGTAMMNPSGAAAADPTVVVECFL